LAERNKN